MKILKILLVSLMLTSCSISQPSIFGYGLTYEGHVTGDSIGFQYVFPWADGEDDVSE